MSPLPSASTPSTTASKSIIGRRKWALSMPSRSSVTVKKPSPLASKALKISRKSVISTSFICPAMMFSAAFFNLFFDLKLFRLCTMRSCKLIFSALGARSLIQVSCKACSALYLSSGSNFNSIPISFLAS
eukprot:Skav226473  [mRNA]  locus=scaffold4441:51772:53790:+ [translate_table: standard]